MRTHSRLVQGVSAIVAVLALVSLAGGAPAQEAADVRRSSAYSSTDDLSDVRLFNSWVADAVFTPGIDLEPLFDWQVYNGFNLWFAGARTAIWVADGVEVGGRLGWAGFDPDGFDGESSFADLELFGRYRLPVDFDGTLAAGGEIALPTGDPEAGQDNTIVRIFSALRKDMDGAFTFTANAGFEYVEFLGGDGNGLTLGLGTLVPLTDELTATGEFNLRTAFDYAIVTGGLDYELPPGGHLRSAIGIGLDDQAPDFQFQVALALPVF